MKVMVVAGARPNYVKAAPLLRALQAAAADEPSLRACFVDAGQHYDDALAGAFHRDLELPPPAHALRVGSGSHAAQTAVAMQRFEPVLEAERPDVVVVFGDVNATLACALVAAKAGVCVAHVEAGLRSFDRTMPEEINRIATDAIADLHFTTEKTANGNLRREGVAAERIHFVGNLMVDSLDWIRQRADASGVRERLGLYGPDADYAVCTLHRPANVDDAERLRELLETLDCLAGERPVLLAAHPRTAARIAALDGAVRVHNVTPGSSAGLPRGRVTLLGPQPYADFVRLLAGARLVLTDSGGIQEETTCLGVPCVTLRDNTERPITITLGTNVLGGTARATILAAVAASLGRGRGGSARPPRWDGKAAPRIVAALLAARPVR